MAGEIAPSEPSERLTVWVPYVVRRAERTFAVEAMPADRSVSRSTCDSGLVSPNASRKLSRNDWLHARPRLWCGPSATVNDRCGLA